MSSGIKLLIGIIVILLVAMVVTNLINVFTKSDFDEVQKTLIGQINELKSQRAELEKKYTVLEEKQVQLKKDKAQLVDDLANIKVKYDKLKQQFNKPLPKPEQDNFFIPRGFTESYYMNDGGRAFPKNDTVKLQNYILDSELCFDERCKLVEKDAKNEEIITVLKDEKVNLTDRLNNCQLSESKYAKLNDEANIEIKKQKLKTSNEKMKKWIYLAVGCLGGFAVGGAH